MLTACAAVRPGPTPSPLHVDRQAERHLELTRQVDELDAVDMQLSFDNAMLEPQLRDSIITGLAGIPEWSGEEVSVTFLPGYIALDIEGTFEFEPGVPTPVALSGDVIPYFQPGRLSWQANLHHLQHLGPAPAVSMADDGPDGAGTSGDDSEKLGALEQSLQAAMLSGGADSIEINPMPLGILETGIRVRAPFEFVRAESSTLDGVLTIQRAATLIEPETTHLALKLGFVPALSQCPDSAQIGRASFTRGIQNREPVGIASGRAPSDYSRVFFTEVVETRSPTTIIHYWFADGQPVSITELGVEPSARWRTWSSAPAETDNASHWQVLVVEKRSGCILAHRALQIERPTPSVAADGAPVDFERTAENLRRKTTGFETGPNSNAPVTVSLNRVFLASALSAAMADLRLTSSLQITGGEATPIQARIGALPADAIICRRQTCESQKVCSLNFENCPVQSDTRDCNSCLLRNPLNNRCIREAQDPICLAARDNENLRLEEKRQTCIDRETGRRDSCLLERQQTLEDCRQQATREVSACAAQVGEMASRFESNRPIAGVSGTATLGGTMTFEFDEFRLESDLQRIRMTLSLIADIEAGGQLGFNPDPGLGPLSQCLQPASDAYRAPLALPPWQGGLVSQVVIEDDRPALLAEWSGLIQRLEANPSPLSQFFSAHRETVSRCDLGLGTEQTLGNVSGSGSELLRGIVDLDMQPEPTRITLLPAYMQTRDKTWSGEAVISENQISFQLQPQRPE